MAGVGGCPTVGGICVACTMPGFPDKFMSFMNQPPGSLLSFAAVQTYGRAIPDASEIHASVAEQRADLASQADRKRSTPEIVGLSFRVFESAGVKQSRVMVSFVTSF